MSRVIVMGAFPRSLINFRGDLLATLAAAGHDVTAMAAVADASEIKALSALGVRFRPFPVRRTGLNPIADLRTLLAIRAAIRDVKPDVLLAYTIKPVVWSGIAVRWAGAIRFYALITGLGYAFHGTSLRRRMLAATVRSLYRIALARAARVIFQNRDNRDAFVADGIVPPDRCAVVDGSGVDVARYALRPLPPVATVFLALGRMLGEKGFREYARAASIVKRRYPEVVFRLVGPEDSSPDGIPPAEIRQWEANGLVEWVGGMDDPRPRLKDATFSCCLPTTKGCPGPCSKRWQWAVQS